MNLKPAILGGLVSAGLIALAAPAAAATIFVDETVDITLLSGTTIRDTPPLSPAFSVSIAEGDTLDYTIHFLAGQTLTLLGPQSIWAFMFSNVDEPESDVEATGSLSLLDGSGTAFTTAGPKSDTEGVVHFGQSFFGFEFDGGGLGSSVTFSGIHYVGTLDNYVNPDITSRIYDDPALSFDARAYRINAGVPEPSAWALMILGFGGAGAMLRRRRGAFALA